MSEMNVTKVKDIIRNIQGIEKLILEKEYGINDRNKYYKDKNNYNENNYNENNYNENNYNRNYFQNKNINNSTSKINKNYNNNDNLSKYENSYNKHDYKLIVNTVIYIKLKIIQMINVESKTSEKMNLIIF
ncbi:hypothetical protein DMUE_1816 [Dictyocoela muelleri]|nr:hypothetical protein DMUE_1816 [Dictyocoela muelleri]